MLHTILWTLTGVLIVVIALAAIGLVIVVAGALATAIRDLRDGTRRRVDRWLVVHHSLDCREDHENDEAGAHRIITKGDR